MKLFIAAIFESGTGNLKEKEEIFFESSYNLQTFFTLTKPYQPIVKRFIEKKGNDNFILDSGAFSMFSGSGNRKLNYVKLKQYVDDYCQYVSRYNIKNFIEMDIDVLIGYDEVKKIRQYITNKVGRKPMEVWHTWRGEEDFERICKENEYVAIGMKQKVGAIDTFQHLINKAFKYGTKVHILGYTPLYIDKIKHIYSCDSTTWSGAVRWGSYHTFQNNKILLEKKDKNVRRKDDTLASRELLIHNYRQWVKYQQYLKNYGWPTE